MRGGFCRAHWARVAANGSAHWGCFWEGAEGSAPIGRAPNGGRQKAPKIFACVSCAPIGRVRARGREDSASYSALNQSVKVPSLGNPTAVLPYRLLLVIETCRPARQSCVVRPSAGRGLWYFLAISWRGLRVVHITPMIGMAWMCI